MVLNILSKVFFTNIFITEMSNDKNKLDFVMKELLVTSGFLNVIETVIHTFLKGNLS